MALMMRYLRRRLSDLLPDPRIFCLVAVTLVILAAAGQAWAQEIIDSDLERRIKAVFLFRFPEFITWSDPAAGDEPFVIEVVGDCDIGEELRQITRGHTLQGRTVEVRQVEDGSDDLPDAAIVFICDGARQRLKQLIQGAPPKALVVTESPGALLQGSVINFVLSDYRVRFEISLSAAKRRGLSLSSRLLDVAMAVKAGT
jgi:hypothetical protein